MAANMKMIKNRIKSIESTMQITKAMELVASSKLRRAKERAEASRPCFHILYEALADIADNNTDFTSRYTYKGKSRRWCYVVIAGDRGMAGGYNTNLFRQMERHAAGKEFEVIPIGKKAVEYCRRRNIQIVTEEFAEAAGISVSDCFSIANLLCRSYCTGEYGHLALCYTGFTSMLSQQPGITSLLPLSDFGRREKAEASALHGLTLYEPDPESVFDAIVPEYLAALVYCAMCESVASELAARRNAMNAASNNAGDMIEQLGLYYNRVRQAGITREITEIIAGQE